MRTGRRAVRFAPHGGKGLSAVVVAVLVTAALAAPQTVAHGKVAAPYALLQVQARGNTAFALDLYSQVCSGSRNTVISPVSISTCLAMAHAGARGETEKEMAQVLHLTVPGDFVHPVFGRLSKMLTSMGEGGELDFTLANGFWIQEGSDLTLPSYRDILRDHYSTEVQHADFVGDIGQARLDINRWVSEQTRGKIPEVLGPEWERITPYVVLANAVYFNGRWQHDFDPGKTERAPFFAAAGAGEQNVDMMHTSGRFRYYDNDTVQVIELPYQGRQASMLVVLPRPGGDRHVRAALTPAKLDSWVSGLESREVLVWLPRFSIGFDLDLTGTLREMGMRRAFSLSSADFSGMVATQSDHCLSSVIHGAIIEVDEKGTVAAAATIISTTLGMGDPDPPVEFRAERPFLFFVRDELTGSILFMGEFVRSQP